VLVRVDEGVVQVGRRRERRRLHQTDPLEIEVTVPAARARVGEVAAGGSGDVSVQDERHHRSTPRSAVAGDELEIDRRGRVRIGKPARQIVVIAPIGLAGAVRDVGLPVVRVRAIAAPPHERDRGHHLVRQRSRCRDRVDAVDERRDRSATLRGADDRDDIDLALVEDIGVAGRLGRYRRRRRRRSGLDVRLPRWPLAAVATAGGLGFRPLGAAARDSQHGDQIHQRQARRRADALDVEPASSRPKGHRRHPKHGLPPCSPRMACSGLSTLVRPRAPIAARRRAFRIRATTVFSPG